ncbi:MAG: hypothetical protein PQ275_29040 [Elizabethkingia anophelis]|nr:MAG: hypothetical protein PQ275_29040 [Elizabethkingia anophelis]
MVTTQADSIKIDLEKKKFIYYGKEMINRKSSVIKRKLITEGNFDDIIRSPNNPHGVILKNWRILDNSEISNESKYSPL